MADKTVSRIRTLLDELAADLSTLYEADRDADVLAMLTQLADYEDSGFEDDATFAAALPRLGVFGKVLATQLHRRGDENQALLSTLGAFVGSGMISMRMSPEASAAHLEAARRFSSAPVGVNDPRGVPAPVAEPGPAGVLSDEQSLAARNRAERGLPPDDGAEDGAD